MIEAREPERASTGSAHGASAPCRGTAFGTVENLVNMDYDVGRTPVRTIGWPRTVRAGIRVFLP